VVSVTDPYGRILGFSRQESLLFLPSISSVVLTRLSGLQQIVLLATDQKQKST
jgi:hypothetical protein